MEGPATKADETEVPKSYDKGKKRPKTTPKKTADERFEEQKRALQKLVIQALRGGKKAGLKPDEVVAVEEALLALGWLPRDLQL